ncbi:MAG: hypothetical protein HUK07_01265 [Bacteroidaceae bacterium]|nr:hypothetical protein [Bacteroidaceae bacterium]
MSIKQDIVLEVQADSNCHHAIVLTNYTIHLAILTKNNHLFVLLTSTSNAPKSISAVISITTAAIVSDVRVTTPTEYFFIIAFILFSI